MPVSLINFSQWKAKSKVNEFNSSYQTLALNPVAKFSALKYCASDDFQKIFEYLKGTIGSFKGKFRFLRYYSGEEYWLRDNYRGGYSTAKNIIPMLLADLVTAFLRGSYNGMEVIDFLSGGQSILTLANGETKVSPKVSSIENWGAEVSSLRKVLVEYENAVSDLGVPFSSSLVRTANSLIDFFVTVSSDGYSQRLNIKAKPGAKVSDADLMIDSFSAILTVMRNFMLPLSSPSTDVELTKATEVVNMTYLVDEDDPYAHLVELATNLEYEALFAKAASSVKLSSKDVFTIDSKSHTFGFNPQLPTQFLITIFDSVSSSVVDLLKVLRHLTTRKDFVLDFLKYKFFESCMTETPLPQEFRDFGFLLVSKNPTATPELHDNLTLTTLKDKIASTAIYSSGCLDELRKVLGLYYKVSEGVSCGVCLHHSHKDGRDLVFKVDFLPDVNPSFKFIKGIRSTSGNWLKVDDLPVEIASAQAAPVNKYLYGNVGLATGSKVSSDYEVAYTGSLSGLRGSVEHLGWYFESTYSPDTQEITLCLKQGVSSIFPPHLGPDVLSFGNKKRRELEGVEYRYQVLAITPSTDFCDLLFAFPTNAVINRKSEELSALYTQRVSEMSLAGDRIDERSFCSSKGTQVVSPSMAFFGASILGTKMQELQKINTSVSYSPCLDMKSSGLPSSVEIPKYYDFTFYIPQALLTSHGLKTLGHLGKIEGPASRDGVPMYTITTNDVATKASKLLFPNNTQVVLRKKLPGSSPCNGWLLSADEYAAAVAERPLVADLRTVMSNDKYFVFEAPQCKTINGKASATFYVAGVLEDSDANQKLICKLKDVFDEPVVFTSVVSETTKKELELELKLHLPSLLLFRFGSRAVQKLPNSTNLVVSLSYPDAAIQTYVQNYVVIGARGDGSKAPSLFRRHFYLDGGNKSITVAVLQYLNDLLTSVYFSACQNANFPSCYVDPKVVEKELNTAIQYLRTNFGGNAPISVIGGATTTPIATVISNLDAIATACNKGQLHSVQEQIATTVGDISSIGIRDLRTLMIHKYYPVNAVDSGACKQIIEGAEYGLRLPTVIDSVGGFGLESVLDEESCDRISSLITQYVNNSIL